MTDTITEPKPNKRTASKARTRQRVLDAATELFAKPGGYEGANIRTIAKAAGMSVGAIFSNFEDKADLYRAIYGHPPISPEQGRELLAFLRSGPQNNLPDFLDLIAGRLVHVHGENASVDYVVSLRDRAEAARVLMADISGAAPCE